MDMRYLAALILTILVAMIQKSAISCSMRSMAAFFACDPPACLMSHSFCRNLST
jgi:hypothetical protein